jgi:glycosyltransferase involved in cell wall biosynthesis
MLDDVSTGNLGRSVLLVVETSGTAGTEAYVESLGHYLAEVCPVQVVALDGDLAAAQDRFAPLSATAVAGPRGLARLLRDHAAPTSLVTLHLYSSLLPAVLAARWSGFKTVTTAHMPLAPWNLRHRMQWRLAVALSHGWVGVTQACRTGLETTLRGKPTATVSGALDLAALPEASGATVATPGRLRVAGVGRLAPEKDWPTLIRACAALDGIELTLYGDGPARAELGALARDLAAPVVFAGYCERDELFRRLRNDGAFALPSRFEGLGLAAVEAMAMGLATVTSDFPGAQAYLEPGVTGLQFPTGNVDELTRCLRQLRDNPKCRAALAAAGRDRVRETFTPERQYAKYLDVLRQVAETDHQ